MKCICGYYYMEDWEIEREDEVFQGELRQNNGNEKFIMLTDKMYEHRDYRTIEHSLWVCPKCGTVRIERW